jgi:hypothetical protein
MALALPLLTDPFILAAVALLVVAPPCFFCSEAGSRGLPAFGESRCSLRTKPYFSTGCSGRSRAKFDRKIADFVVCDREALRVVALIELDDRMHTAQADRQRDALTNAAGYKTIRYKSKQKPTEAEIAALFQHARVWVPD